MLLPAVQRVRESARRVQCSDQIRQLALSAQNFHSKYRIFPTNGGAAIGNKIVAVNGQKVKPFTHDFIAGSQAVWGVAWKRRAPRDQTGPWCFSILPQIELSNAYESDAYIDELRDFSMPFERPKGVRHCRQVLIGSETISQAGTQWQRRITLRTGV